MAEGHDQTTVVAEPTLTKGKNVSSFLDRNSSGHFDCEGCTHRMFRGCH